MGAFATAEAKALVERRAQRATQMVDGLDSKTLLEQCEAIWNASMVTRRDEERVRGETPVMRIWDAEWHMQHLVGNPLSYEFEWVENDTGTGEIVVFAESSVGQWLIDIDARIQAGQGVAPHITCDYVGGRWGGRLEDVSIEATDTGDEIVTATFLHDYENVKWIECWPTPFLPAAIQWKAWILLGPSDWCALTTLMVNLWRSQNSLLTLPDDPLDLSSYSLGFDVSEWPIVVNPISFIDAMAGGSLWSMPIIRMKTWHDAFQAILADAELSVQADRWLEGDDEPWEGANLRSGTLVISIVNKSGRYTGTSESGNLFAGLFNTIAQFTADSIDTTLSLITDTDMPGEYLTIGYKSTDRTMPYVILRPGHTPGVISAKFTVTPEKGYQILTGGRSMPGVNEAISAIIQAIGDVIGDNIVVPVLGNSLGSIGGAIDALLKPFYENTILAWTATTSQARGQNMGWSRYFEFFQDGADQAYTLNSLMVIRTGLWATRRKHTHEIRIMDACPWTLGDNGVGHMWLSDRVGTTAPRDNSGKVWVDRIVKMVLKADETTFHPDWDITIGGDKDTDPFLKAMGWISQTMTGLHDVGVV